MPSDLFHKLASTFTPNAYELFARSIGNIDAAQYLYTRVYCDSLMMFYYPDRHGRVVCADRLKDSSFGALICSLNKAMQLSRYNLFDDRGAHPGIKMLYWGCKNWVHEERSYGFIPMLRDHLIRLYGDKFSQVEMIALLQRGVTGMDTGISNHLISVLRDEQRIEQDESIHYFINS
jgi:hypothetical protein